MLASPSDYEFVDVSRVGHYINGSFLPTVNPKSATALLCYEAYLFMLEAWYERMNIDQAGANSISPQAAPTLLKSSLRGIPIYSRGVGNSSSSAIGGATLDNAPYSYVYVNQDTAVSDGLVEWHTSTPAKDVDSMLTGFTLKAWEQQHPYYGMLPDWRLLSDYIRCKLWELNSMRKALIPLKMSAYCTSATVQVLKSDGSVESEIPQAVDTQRTSTICSWAQEQPYGTYQRMKLVVNYRDSFPWTLVHATSAVLIWNVQVHTSSQRASVWGKRDVSAAGGVLSVESGFLDTIALEALTIAGIGVGKAGTSANNAKVWLLVDFDFPANLDGSGWDWTPQSV